MWGWQYRVVIQVVDIVWQGWVWQFLGLPLWRRRGQLAEYRHGTLYWTGGAPPEGVPVRIYRV